MEFRDWILEHKTDAKFYIENRNAYPIFYIKEAVEGLEKEKNAIPEEIQSEIDAEDAALTVQPKNKTKDGVVQIVLDDNVIRVKYILDENFRNIVKSLGYGWKGTWERRTDEFTGSPEDRIAELGSVLLEKGFTVKFPNRITKDAAINSVFEPECHKWIKFHEPNKIRIVWDSFDNRLYKRAKRLPGATWKEGAMVVSVEFYEKILKFAEEEEFKISKKAENEIDNFISTEKNSKNTTQTQIQGNDLHAPSPSQD